MLSNSYWFYVKDPLINVRFLDARDKNCFIKPLGLGEIVELNDKEYQIINIIHKKDECQVCIQPISDYVHPLDYKSPIKPLLEKVENLEMLVDKLVKKLEPKTKRKTKTEDYT